MNYSSGWDNPPVQPTITEAKPSNPWDALNQDQLLVKWDEYKKAIEMAKASEMELRKYIVGRAFPNPNEGTNTLELGNDYKLKAVVKFNYNLSASNDDIEAALDRIAKIGNRGTVVAERLISWKPSFLLTEYRLLEEEKNTSNDAKEILNIISKILTISEAAPTLEIKEPQGKKK